MSFAMIKLTEPGQKEVLVNPFDITSVLGDKEFGTTVTMTAKLPGIGDIEAKSA